LNNDDIWELNKESMGGLEHDLPEILEVENNTFPRKWSTGFSNMKDALIFSKQHEPSKDLGTSEEITQLERSLSQTQKPLSMRLPQTIKSHAPKEQICLNTLNLQNVARQEDDPKSLSCKDSHFERYHPKATHEKSNYVDSIFTLFTPNQIQENQDMRKPRIEYLGQTSEDSRVKLEEPQVYAGDLPQHFPKPSNDRTNLSTSMAYILQKVKRIRGMLEIPSLTKQIPDDQQSFEETSTLLQTGHFEQNEQTPFLTSLLIDDLYLHNCMLDSESSVNMMSLKVMNQLGLEVTGPYTDVRRFESKGIKVYGLMEGLQVHLVDYLISPS
jgi:hypothetical protein